jgi:hypothetical protein
MKAPRCYLPRLKRPRRLPRWHIARITENGFFQIHEIEARHSGSISTSASGTVTISTLPRGTMVPTVTLKLTLVTGGYSVTR